MENLIYIIFYILLPMIGLNAIITVSENLLIKTKNINLATQMISSSIIKKHNSIFSKINNINEWIQLVIMVSLAFMLILLFPLSDFYKIKSEALTVLNSFEIFQFNKVLFLFMFFDLYFLNINSKENTKIKNYTLVSILELIIIYFIFKQEHIETTWEVLKIQNTLMNLWVYKHAILIFILLCMKIYKLLMLLEAYTNNEARNLRLVNEALMISVFAFGGFISLDISILELLTLTQIISSLIRIMIIYLFLKMFFNQIPRRYHVEV